MFSEQFYIDTALAKHTLTGVLTLNIPSYFLSETGSCLIPTVIYTVLMDMIPEKKISII